MDVAQGSAAQTDGGGHVRELGVHQHHVGGVNGHVGARATGDAGVGTGQGLSLIHILIITQLHKRLGPEIAIPLIFLATQLIYPLRFCLIK